MPRLLLSLFVSLIFSLTLASQKKENITLITFSKEAYSGDQVKSVSAALLDYITNDTIAKGGKEFLAIIKDNFQIPVTRLTFLIPKIPGEYRLVATAPGYDTIYQDIKLDNLGKREYEKTLPDLVFYKTATTLNEVSVSATKVKFYNNGDTLVYNADAFALPEGSMLDALINQLPGVELRAGGEIYVNGKKVESLLLNGKNFFKDNQNLILNNLGAYIVKTVEVYNKRSDMSELMGVDFGDSQYVMDVKLKKEYLSGFIGNIEAGYGSANRYMGRVFSLWYTKRSRLGIIGNINNLNDQRTPGERSNWTASQLPGDIRTKMVGIDYQISPEEGKKWEFSGNTTFSHVRNTSISSVYQTNFLPQGDNFQDNYSNTINRDLNVKTNNSFRFRVPNLHWGNTISQNLSYSENKVWSNNLSGVFQENIEDMTRSLLAKIYTGEITSFNEITINSSLQQTLSASKNLITGGSLFTSYSIPHTPDYIALEVNVNYKKTNYYGFDFYDINYNQLGSNKLNYQYVDNHPDRNWKINVNPSYFYKYSSNGSLYFAAGWEHSSMIKDSYLYELDRLSDTGVFGVLPSDYLATLDIDKTYLSSEISDRGAFYMNYSAKYEIGKGKLQFQIIPSFSFRWRKYHYIQGSFDQYLKKRSADLQFNYSFIRFSLGQHQLELLYQRTTDLAPMDRMVDIANTRNPLNIYIGNPDLKNSMRNELTLSWNFNKSQKHRWSNTVNFKLNLHENALTSGYSFDSETGVRTYKMYNVNGNYLLSAREIFYKTFGSIDQFDISSNTGVDFSKASDLTALNNLDFIKATVKNLILMETLRLGWTIGKQSLGLNGSILWRNTRSENSSFADFSAITAQYGVTLKLNLPHNFSFSTDYNFYTRTGFSEASLNKTDMVWNARLSYTLKGGRWLFMVDGFDILHQLTNVTYNVNALGRTETYKNTLPRYVLFHIQYRFDVKPKKKGF